MERAAVFFIFEGAPGRKRRCKSLRDIAFCAHYMYPHLFSSDLATAGWWSESQAPPRRISVCPLAARYEVSPRNSVPSVTRIGAPFTMNEPSSCNYTGALPRYFVEVERRELRNQFEFVH